MMGFDKNFSYKRLLAKVSVENKYHKKHIKIILIF